MKLYYVTILIIYITVKDKHLYRINDTIKSKIEAKNALYIKCIQNGRFESDFDFLIPLHKITIKFLRKYSSLKFITSCWRRDYKMLINLGFVHLTLA